MDQNHSVQSSNSFFDAINIAVQYPHLLPGSWRCFQETISCLLLKKLAFNSIYRLSEGKENLSKNMETFEMCLTLLKQNQTILIFLKDLRQRMESKTFKKEPPDWLYSL
jgi:hypothetical protein